MTNNVIQLKDWVRFPKELKGLDRQIHDLLDELSDLLDLKDQHLAELDETFDWAIKNNTSDAPAEVQEALSQFYEALVEEIEWSGESPKTFEDVQKIVAQLDHLIDEKNKVLTDKRMESLKMKWGLLSQTPS